MENVPALRENEVVDEFGVISEAAPLIQKLEDILPPLTPEEDMFALALVETSGNPALAYQMAFGEDVTMPLARGRQLLTRANVALRYKELLGTVEIAKEIVRDAHLQELAVIRDLAKATGQIKVAYQSERSRGEVYGLYQQEKGPSGPQVAVQVNFVSKHDESI